MYHDRRLFMRISTFFCCAIVALSFATAPFAHHVAAAPPRSADHITLLINPGTPGFPVPPAFLGFSIEPTNMCNLVTLAQQDPALAQLFKNLGTGNMRIGGTTVENTTWYPSAAQTCRWTNTLITPTLVTDIFAFAQQAGWTITWTVPLKNFNPQEFVDEASYVAQFGGSTLSSIEFGNEPNRYGLSFAQYQANWETYYNDFRVNNPTTPVSGPSVNPSSPDRGGWFVQFINAEGSKIAFATAHRYYGSPGGPHPPTIQRLLSKAIIHAAALDFQNMYQLTQQQHLLLQFNETNNFDLGGVKGVSDVFAAALWGTDYLFTGLDYGVTQMDIHGVPNNPSGNNRGTLNYYSPINDDGTPTPLYYAMLLFHYVAANGGQQVPVQLSGQGNVSAHAILGSNGQLNLVIVNKDAHNAAHVAINTTQSYSQAQGISLIAPSLSSTSNILFGGSPIGADGSWRPTNFKQIPVNGASSNVTVPAGSALVITYS